MVVFNDGFRVVVKNDDGNVMLDCSRDLFDSCWMRGWFEDVPETANPSINIGQPV